MKGYIEDKSLYILSGFTKHSDFKLSIVLNNYNL